MLVTKADRETVPEIDQAYQCGEVDQLLILEVPADFVVGRIGRRATDTTSIPRPSKLTMPRRRMENRGVLLQILSVLTAAKRRGVRSSSQPRASHAVFWYLSF